MTAGSSPAAKEDRGVPRADPKAPLHAKAEALALRVMADRLEHEEEIPELKEVFAISA